MKLEMHFWENLGKEKRLMESQDLHENFKQIQLHSTIFSKCIVKNTYICWNRQKWNGTQNPETEPSVCENLVYDQDRGSIFT